MIILQKATLKSEEKFPLLAHFMSITVIKLHNNAMHFSVKKFPKEYTKKNNPSKTDKPQTVHIQNTFWAPWSLLF